MLDPATARMGIDAISTAIAARLESGLEAATAASGELSDYQSRTVMLREVTNDVLILGAALLVLSRTAAGE